MKNLEVKELLKQHEEKYRTSLLDLIQNNTDGLVDQDLASVFKKPPLDSMDFLRTKLLDLAKKNKVVFDTEKMDSVFRQFREFLLDGCEELKNIRIQSLGIKVKKTKVDSHHTIVINKKDFGPLNQKMKGIIKEKIKEGSQTILFPPLKEMIVERVPDTLYSKIEKEYTKYVIGSYQKQLLESCELKIMVKDTTLMNSIKELGDRYLFTLEHSHLLKEEDA